MAINIDKTYPITLLPPSIAANPDRVKVLDKNEDRLVITNGNPNDPAFIGSCPTIKFHAVPYADRPIPASLDGGTRRPFTLRDWFRRFWQPNNADLVRYYDIARNREILYSSFTSWPVSLTEKNVSTSFFVGSGAHLTLWWPGNAAHCLDNVFTTDEQGDPYRCANPIGLGYNILITPYDQRTSGATLANPDGSSASVVDPNARDSLINSVDLAVFGLVKADKEPLSFSEAQSMFQMERLRFLDIDLSDVPEMAGSVNKWYHPTHWGRANQWPNQTSEVYKITSDLTGYFVTNPGHLDSDGVIQDSTLPVPSDDVGSIHVLSHSFIPALLSGGSTVQAQEQIIGEISGYDLTSVYPKGLVTLDEREWIVTYAEETTRPGVWTANLRRDIVSTGLPTLQGVR